MKRFLAVLVAAGVAGLSGCASARYVEKNPDSGIIAIPSNADFWPMKYRTDALAKIEQHVGPNYEIIEEKEVVTGVTTSHNQHVTREPAYHPDTPFIAGERQTIMNTTSSTDRTEHRIAYRRKPAPFQTNSLPPNVQPVGGAQPAADAVVPAGGVRPANKPADCDQ